MRNINICLLNNEKIELCIKLVFLLLQDLFDEHARSILGRWLNKLLVFSASVYDGLDKSQILPAISVVGTLIFIIAVGYFMAYLV